MDEYTLKSFFKICKKIEPNKFYTIINNIENQNYLSKNLNIKELSCIRNLATYYGDLEVAKNNMMMLYAKYHNLKNNNIVGGASLKDKINIKTLKTVASKSAEIIGKLIKKTAVYIYNFAKENPDQAMDFVKLIHKNTTEPLINVLIKDETTQKTINDLFEQIFKIAKESITKKSVSKPSQTGGINNSVKSSLLLPDDFIDNDYIYL